MSQIQIFEVYDTGILTSTEILFYLRPIVTANEKNVNMLPSKTDFVEQRNSESTQEVANTTTDKSIELLNRVTTSSETKNERDTYLHRNLKNEHKPLEKTGKLETLKLFDKPSTSKNTPQILNPLPSSQSTPYSPEKKFDFDMSKSSGKRKPFNEDFSSPIGRNQRVSYDGPSSLLRSLNEDKW